MSITKFEKEKGENVSKKEKTTVLIAGYENKCTYSSVSDPLESTLTHNVDQFLFHDAYTVQLHSPVNAQIMAL